MEIDYSLKKFWTVYLLEEILKNYTVIDPKEHGDFELLWQVKLDCEKNVGFVIRPA